MNVVVVPALDAPSVAHCQQALEEAGASVRLVTPAALPVIEEVMATAGGLLLPDGPPVSPACYEGAALPEGEPAPCPELDGLGLRLLSLALELDMPVLALGRGMCLLNLACGGSLLSSISGHQGGQTDARGRPQRRVIFLSPGSKTAPIIGAAGFYRVVCQHRQGLREAQRAPMLMASAYDTEDLVIEGLESARHSWVIALQAPACQPDATPKLFNSLFLGLAERASRFRKEN